MFFRTNVVGLEQEQVSYSHQHKNQSSSYRIPFFANRAQKTFAGERCCFDNLFITMWFENLTEGSFGASFLFFQWIYKPDAPGGAMTKIESLRSKLV